jgi:hypothetical protein
MIGACARIVVCLVVAAATVTALQLSEPDRNFLQTIVDDKQSVASEEPAGGDGWATVLPIAGSFR